jgi:hypothetical protein
MEKEEDEGCGHFFALAKPPFFTPLFGLRGAVCALRDAPRIFVPPPEAFFSFLLRYILERACVGGECVWFL